VRAEPPCTPCILSRVLRLAEAVTDDAWLHNRILGEIMEFLRRRTVDRTPAELMTEVALRASKILGISDPYARRKALWQEELLASEDRLRGRLVDARRPLELAVKFACLANIFDDDLARDLAVAELFDKAEDLTLHTEVWDDFKRDLKQARKVLFVHAAAGEIVVDKLLLERLAGKERTSVVRQGPLLGCATRKEAEEAGLGEIVSKIIDPGIDTLGLPASQCSQEVRAALQEADLVIAKGQAAFETLAAEKERAYVLFRVKCRVVGSALGLQPGDLVLERTGAD